MTSIQCIANGCEAECATPEPGLTRGLKLYRNFTVDPVSFNDDRIIRRPKKMSLGMLITTSQSFGLNVIEAKCDFKLLATYGCIACNKPSIAIFQSINIASNGLVEFKSNCSLGTNVLACQQFPQQITIDGHQENCQIEINNQTIILDVDYIFEGAVYSIGAVISSGSDNTPSQMLTSFMLNPNFITSLSSMLAITFMAGFLLTATKAILKYGTAYAALKAGKEVNNMA